MLLREINFKDKIEICKMCEEIRKNDLSNQFEGLSNLKNVDENSFEKFLIQLQTYKEIEKIKPYLVNQTTYVLVDENNHIYGGVNIRHKLNEKLMEHGGHIGMLIRPSERRKGYASLMLSLALEKCKLFNIENVLITCREENIGSRKSIEKNLGIYENSFYDSENGSKYRRYWIKINILNKDEENKNNVRYS